MKAEHNQEDVIKNFARFGAYIDALNANRETKERFNVSLERELMGITPSWRIYAQDIWVGEDDFNFDEMEKDQRIAVTPKAGAVVCSQFGDHFTIETQDLNTEGMIVISVNGNAAVVKFEVGEMSFWGILGKYTSEGEITTKNQWVFKNPLLLYSIEQLKVALQKGWTFTMPPTNFDRSLSLDYPFCDDPVCPF